MKNSLNLLRTALCVTQRCTLKCKLCLAFMPYYENPVDVTFNEAEKILSNYFEIIDSVQRFSVTGGEPLMNKDLAKIMELVYSYAKKNENCKDAKIIQSVDFVTNATLDIPKDILSLFEENKDYTRVVLSDYGDLSTKIEKISNELNQRNITFRVSNFHGDNLYYDGWIDFSDHSEKVTGEAREEQGRNCVHRSGKYYVINDGELHSCSRSFWRMRNGYIPKNEQEYIPLLDDSMSVDQKRENLQFMLSQDSSTSCGHCVGLLNGVKRYKPAEQL